MTDYRLWTPVANALEAYRRRVMTEPGAVYEHTWRLIHIHESLVVTLGTALATRLLSLWRDDNTELAEANRLRRKVTGLSSAGDPDADSDLSNGDACLDGFIKPWIDLLKDFSAPAENTGCSFCKSLASYLTSKPGPPLAFIESWKRVAEVPQVFLGDLSRVDRFDAFNSFRNKLAHVPVPHKILHDLHWGLRQEIFSLLSPDYKPNQDSPANDYDNIKWFPPLKGRLLFQRSYLTGSSGFGEIKDAQHADTGGLVLLQPQETQGTTTWSASPFIHIDPELKVSLLFLLNDLRTDSSSEMFKGEFHRFHAEILPVQKELVPQSLIRDWIPVPPNDTRATLSEPLPSEPADRVVEPHPQDSVPQADLDERSSYELRRIGDDAFRVRDYFRAVNAYEKLAETNDAFNYNDVAKSKHGGALWRVAESKTLQVDDKEQRIRKAVLLLENASGHRDPKYRARALYEKSKALWHLWKVTGDLVYLRDALESAGEAAKVQHEPAFISWYERVEDDLEAGAENK